MNDNVAAGAAADDDVGEMILVDLHVRLVPLTMAIHGSLLREPTKVVEENSNHWGECGEAIEFRLVRVSDCSNRAILVKIESLAPYY